MSDTMHARHADPVRARASLFTHFGITLLLGLVAALAAIVTSLASAKALIVLPGAVMGIAFVFLLNDSRKLELVLVGVLAVTLSINLDVHFLWRLHTGVPSIYISISILVLAALYVTWIYRYITGQLDPPLRFRRMLLWAHLMYMAWCMVTLFNAHDASLVFLEQYQNLVLLAAAVAMMNLRDRRTVGVFLTFLAVAVFTQGVFATAQYLTGSNFGLEIFGERELVDQNVGFSTQRSSGTVGHPNALGYFFEITLPLVLAMLLMQRSLVVRAALLAVLVLGLVGIFTTLSRGAWLTLPISFTFVLCLLYLRRLFRLSSFIGMCVGAIVILGALSFAFPTIKARFSYTDNRSAASRVEMNAGAWSIIKQFPMTGVGLNNLSEVYFDLDRTGRSYVLVGPVIDGVAMVTRHRHHVVHNMYLWVWVDTGIVGLALFLWIFACVFLMGASIYIRGDPWQRHVVVGLLGGLLAHLAHGMIDPGFRLVGNVALLLYCYMGLVAALGLIGKDESGAAPDLR